MRKFDDSAQLLLLAAFAIGFTLVISTIMLNNIIYASNMASESTSDIGNYEISNIAQMTEEATRAAYNDKSNFSEYMESYASELSKIYASRGYSFSFENSTLNDNPYLTENGLAGGNSDWMVIKNVNQTGIFEIGLTDTSKLGNESNAYEVHATDQSGTSLWFMKIYNDSTNINITLSNNTYQEPINTYLVINVTDNRIFNTTKQFYFSDSTASGPYNIEFINSSNALGYYTISGELADELVDGSSFDLRRREVINATMSIASPHNMLNVTIPVTVP